MKFNGQIIALSSSSSSSSSSYSAAAAAFKITAAMER